MPERTPWRWRRLRLKFARLLIATFTANRLVAANAMRVSCQNPPRNYPQRRPLENPGIRLVPPKDVPVVGTTPNAIAPSFFQNDETLPVYEAGFDLPHPAPVIANAERVEFAAEEA